MTDHNELLADTDKRIPVVRGLCGEGTADLVADLASALRAALAARSEPDLRTIAWQFNEAVSLLREARGYVPEFMAEDIDAGLPAIDEALKAAAAAGSATPEEECP